ncbi:endonuclease/exonuclease/phosphatase family protein [Sediminibacterium roseum]|uniref:Endonuclease/exonuclease/phosphatase family protein n=1 Tax=Sediminibacterium roseum TaxID=1978412 RepID=A0ABW9ZUX6_9BACT|nr:endonuclease/exonuclease/phosphatase family protein [Sediminibacterium roseum]NCI50295.1 endonuclease/exonuclease/phosphatase family protein [Sediminibacterium roseum]
MRALFTLFCVCAIFSVSAQTFNVATYNLRYDNKNDSGNLWVNRAPVVASLIQFHDFDVFGIQEGLKNQLDDLAAQLKGYSFYGKGRDDGKDKGEHSSVFYKTDVFKLLNQGDFWLSETPEKPGPGWDARLNRICSWVQLQHKQSKRKFYFFSVHYDHQGVKARIESSKLILQKIKEIAGNEPAIFVGDLNGGRESEWYKNLAATDWLKDTYVSAPVKYASNGSFNSFGKQNNSNEVIDHIFTTGKFDVAKWGILTDTYHGKYPSDHFPVMVRLTLLK